MAWQRREGYYYRSERNGSQVRSVYLGYGPVAARIAELDACRKNAAAETRAAWQRERTAMAAEDAEVVAVDDAVTALAHAVLFTAGYHQHHHGDWRRRRV